MVEDTGKLRLPSHYQAYLLRLWREDATQPWRVVVTYVPTGVQQHFKSLEAGFAFIAQQLETTKTAPPTPGEG